MTTHEEHEKLQHLRADGDLWAGDRSEPGRRSPDRVTTVSGDARERLARFMFDLQADAYEAGDALREQAWAEDDVSEFWLGQAGAVVTFLQLELCV
jgi:hypothetical protein